MRLRRAKERSQKGLPKRDPCSNKPSKKLLRSQNSQLTRSKLESSPENPLKPEAQGKTTWSQSLKDWSKASLRCKTP
jgi:hypothetical protein